MMSQARANVAKASWTKKALAASALMVALVMGGLVAPPAHATTTFSVSSTSDLADANLDDGICSDALGACTLRAAIQQANKTTGADTIVFGIPDTGVQTVTPTSPLPTITEAVVINGYTQTGASLNTLRKGTNAKLMIELDGTNAGSGATGLSIASKGPDGPNTVIKGLVINRFKGDGIRIIGDTPSSTIGSNNRIEGNFIGTDPSGTEDLGNGGSGVFMASGGGGQAANNTVGGISPDKRNLLSGNGGAGVSLIDAEGNHVLGNLLGTKKDGITALGNRFAGVGISGSPDNTVGDGSPEGANTIAFNGLGGVLVGNSTSTTSTTSNHILRNSIFSNAGLGIDLGNDGPTPNDSDDPATPEPDPDSDTGPNTLQNKPVLSSAKTVSGTTTIKGTLNSSPNLPFLVQFFSNPSGNEGKKFIGQKEVRTDGSGNVTFTFKPRKKVAAGRTITATATDGVLGNTSEFSAPKKVVAA